MRRLTPITVLTALAACAMPGTGPEPSLAPRAAEAIDPRLPIPGDVPTGPADAALVRQLGALVGQALDAVPAFQSRETEAARLAAAAGPVSSESWVAAQQSLSRLVEQYGVTTRAAGDIDALGAERLKAQRWIRPADQDAIAAAAAEVDAIDGLQAGAIARLRKQLAR